MDYKSKRMSKIVLLLVLAVTLVVAGCTSYPSNDGAKNPSEPPKPEVKYMTGRLALQNLLAAGRLWTADSQPVRLTSETYVSSSEKSPSDDMLGKDGKSSHWRALFASAARQQMKPYAWSGGGGDSKPGIMPGSEDQWSASNSSTRPFDLNFLKTDSSQAYEVAQKHGGSDAKYKSVPVNYSLEWDHSTSKLLWHVLYGKNSNEPDLHVVIDATSGAFFKIQK